MASRTVTQSELGVILSSNNTARTRACQSWLATNVSKGLLPELEPVKVQKPPGSKGRSYNIIYEVSDEVIESLKKKWEAVKVKAFAHRGSKKGLSVQFKDENSEEYKDLTTVGESIKPPAKPLAAPATPIVPVEPRIVSGPGRIFRVELFDLAVYLIARGHNLVRVEQNHHRMPFCFEITDELMRDQFAYQTGDDMISAHQFYLAQKLVNHIKYNKIVGPINLEEIQNQVNDLRRTWGPPPQRY